MIIRIFTLADSAVARLQWDHGVTIVTDTANQSESCRIAVSQYIMLAGEDTGEDTGEGALGCSTTGATEVVDFALRPTHYYSYIPYHVCSYKPRASVRGP